MEDLARNHGKGKVAPLTDRALRQCVREMLLAQSSDWPFIISQATSEEYAARRVRDHVARFHAIADGLDGGAVDEGMLDALERIDNLFLDVTYKFFAE